MDQKANHKNLINVPEVNAPAIPNGKVCLMEPTHTKYLNTQLAEKAFNLQGKLKAVDLKIQHVQVHEEEVREIAQLWALCKINLDRVLWATEYHQAKRNLEAAIISCAISEAARWRCAWQARDVMDAVADHLLKEMRNKESKNSFKMTKRRMLQETADRMVVQMEYNLGTNNPPQYTETCEIEGIVSYVQNLLTDIREELDEYKAGKQYEHYAVDGKREELQIRLNDFMGAIARCRKMEMYSFPNNNNREIQLDDNEDDTYENKQDDQKHSQKDIEKENAEGK